MPKVTTPSKKTLKTTKKGKEKSNGEASIILYPEVEIREAFGENALTVEQAKELLGWEEETEEVKFGSDYILTDETGKKIRCTNNAKNRPFYKSWCDQLAQEHLRKHWKLNGETVVIGKTGQVLSAQHRLISLILADQRRLGKQAPHWEEYWSGPVTMDTLLVFGIAEDDATVNTLDTGKPRSLTDVIFRSAYFANLKVGDRREVSRMADYAIRMLWHRTGASKDAFNPYRTHAESLDFLARHEKVLEAVKHIFEENSDDKISKFFSPGYAAAFMYLMGTSKTDGDTYRTSDHPSESDLDFKNWNKAEEFWTLFAGASDEVKEARYAIAALVNSETGKGGATPKERTAIICKAWTAFLAKGKIKESDVQLKFHTDDEGIRKLVEFPDVGGIDLGEQVEVNDEDEEVEDNSSSENEDESKEEETPKKKPRGKKVADPTEEEIEAGKEEALKKREAHKAKLEENRKKRDAAKKSKAEEEPSTNGEVEEHAEVIHVSEDEPEEGVGEETPEPTPEKKPTRKPIARKTQN